MPVVDDRGRLFGKINLIDAAVAILVLLLLPLSYSAYLLFRTLPPTIGLLRPATVTAGTNATVELTGTNLRPFLRARIGGQEAKAFLIQSPSRGEIKVPDLPPGTYDIILYDEGQELVRRTAGLTIVAPTESPSPPPGTFSAQVRGVFTNLTNAEVRGLKVGIRFSGDAGASVAEVLALDRPEPAMQRVKIGPNTVISTPIPANFQVPAILDVRCALAADGCRVGSTVLDRGVMLTLMQEGKPRVFQVDEVRASGSPVVFPAPPMPPAPDAVVRLFGTFTALDEAQAKDLRVGTRFGATGDAFAEVLSLQRAEPASQPVRVGPSTLVTPIAGRTQLNGVIRVRCTPVADGCRVGDTVLARNATLLLPQGHGVFRFLISEVRGTAEPVPGHVRVHFVARPELRNLIKVGDTDVSLFGERGERSATLTAVGEMQTLESQVSITLDPEPDPSRRQAYHSVPQQVIAFDATLNVPLERGRLGWQYQGDLVKVGSPFAFDTALYTLRGWVVEVTPGERGKK